MSLVGLGPAWTDVVTALATCVLAVATITAGAFAVVQIRLARVQREDQLRPYVFIDFEVDDRHLIYLRLQNVGRTAATNVRFDCQPPLVSFSDRTVGSSSKPSDFIRKTWPTLPPGKAITSWFDVSHERMSDPDLPNRFVVTARYEAPTLRNRELNDSFVLDLDAYRGRMYPQARDLRSLVEESEALRKAAQDQATSLSLIADLLRDVLDPPEG